MGPCQPDRLPRPLELDDLMIDVTPVPTRRPRLQRHGILRELIATLFFIVAVYALAEMSFPRSNLEGPSMEPTFFAGQYLLISRVHYLFGEPEYGDIVVFQRPDYTPQQPRLIKRLIGLPGDTIEIRERLVYRNGQQLDEPYFVNAPCTFDCADRLWLLGPDEYFVMGDNRNRSQDSRDFGVIHRALIVGEAVFRYWPIDQIGSVIKIGYPTP